VDGVRKPGHGSSATAVTWLATRFTPLPVPVIASTSVLSHPNRGTSRKGEASASPSHQDEAPAPLTWWDSTNGLRTCLMIGEAIDGAGYLTHLRHRS